MSNGATQFKDWGLNCKKFSFKDQSAKHTKFKGLYAKNPNKKKKEKTKVVCRLKA